MALTKASKILLIAGATIVIAGFYIHLSSLKNIGSSIDAAIKNDKDNLSSPIVHKVFSYEGMNDAKVVSIYNSLGDIKILQSIDDQVRVNVSLVQTKTINDLDTKLNNLQIKPQETHDILFYEPLASDGITNYWEWINDNLNANGVKVDFELQIPQSIQEVRLYNEIGNISLNDITARIYAQTDLGVITGQNITPVETAILKTNLPTNGKTGIDVNFASLELAKNITAGISLDNIILSVPSNAQYTHETNRNLKVEYDNPMYSRFDYCKEQCLEEFKPIQPKQGITVITTTPAEDKLKTVTIK